MFGNAQAARPEHIELVITLVISVGVTGLLLIFTSTVHKSADPLVRKQALAVAESLLNEVLAQPFTFCDPQDPANDAALPPANSGACTGGAAGSQDKGGGVLGPQPGTETRFSNTDPFDNVADYHGYAMNNGIFGLDNSITPVPGLSAYTASVSVTRALLRCGLLRRFYRFTSSARAERHATATVPLRTFSTVDVMAHAIPAPPLASVAPR